MRTIGNLADAHTHIPPLIFFSSDFVGRAFSNYLETITLTGENGNCLHGSIPSDMLTATTVAKVREINMWGNALTGQIPAGLGTLAQTLTHLELQENYLGGTLPPELGDLSALTSLNLSNNRLKGTIPLKILATVPVLLEHYSSEFSPDYLDNVQSHSGISGTLPASWGKLTNLVELVRSTFVHVPCFFAAR